MSPSLPPLQISLARDGLVILASIALITLAALNALAQPANDNFASAEVITGPFGSVTGSNVGATGEPGEPNHLGFSLGNSVWYQWTAPADGQVAFHTIGSDFDTLLAVYKGPSLTRLECIAGNDDLDPSDIGPSGVKFIAAAGTTYYIAVDGYFGDTGDIVLSWGYSAAGIFRFTSDEFFYAETESAGVRNSSVVRSVRGALITVTRLFGTQGRVLVDYETEDDDAIDGVDYIGRSGTLVFEDYEMSKSFVVPIIYDGGIPFFNRSFIVTLLSAQLDPLESPEIAPPLISPTLGEAIVTILDADIDPVLDRNFDTNGMFAGPTNSVFNFEKKVYRTREDIGTVTVHVLRFGTNTAAETINYTINSTPINANNHRLNTPPAFPLQAASDYATPDPPDILPSPRGIARDYTPVNGTISWGQGDFVPKPIDIPILDDERVEFNEDLLIQLYRVPSGGGAPQRVGMYDTATLTILYDEFPAGAVDSNHNPDYSASTVPPFNPHPGANNTVFAVALQTDGKAVLGGNFTAYNTIPRNRIARANSDGSHDASFNPGSGANGFISSLAIAGNGSIVIGGGFSAFNGIQRNAIARLNANGSLDATFNPGLGANGTVWAVTLQSDGKVLIGGEFTSVNGFARSFIARLNADGSVDPTFDPGPNGPNGFVNAIDLAPDGKAIIGGEFSMLGGTNRNAIARLNSDGTLDTSFDPGTGADDAVYAVKLQSDGRVLIGGAFTRMDLRDRRSIARLNPDGSLDTSFDPGSGADDVVYSISLQSDGKIVLGGLFKAINQTRRVAIARLFAHGPVDTSFMDTAYNQFAGLINPYFNQEVNPRNFIFSTAIQSNGNILIGGGFTRVGGGRLNANIQPTVNDREPLTRAAIRNRRNFARLLGGDTTGPGNIEFAYDSYTADEHGVSLYITMVRTNGNLGPISAGFTTPTLPPGPGAAEIGFGADFTCSSGGPQYVTSYPQTRMRSDGLFGPNNSGTLTVISNLFINDIRDDVYVDILEDTLIEGDETTGLELSVPNGLDIFFLGGENVPLGAALGRSRATLTIVDNDFKPGVLSFSSPTYTVNENGGSATITVIRTDGSSGIVTVQYATSNGTAIAGSDYTARSGTLSFGEGQTNRTFTIPIIDDSSVEPDETVNLRLFGATGGATLGVSNAVLTIVDNDFLPGRVNFSSATYSTNEDAGAAIITVTRTGGNQGVLSVYYATSNGTAIAGADYVGVTNVLTWNNGDTSPRAFAIPLINDGFVEGNETVNVRLFNPTVNGVTNNEALGLTTTAVLTIVDDDAFGSLRFSTDRYTVAENGGFATITVVRTGGSAETISVNFATLNGTAVAPFDYSSTNGVLVFGPGEVSKTFRVFVVDNLTPDAPGRFVTLALSNPFPPGTLGNPQVAILEIIDNESVNEPAGSIDSAFNPSATINGDVFALTLQSTGKILVGGAFTAVNNIVRNRIARLESDGTLDAKFAAGFGGANGTVRALISQTDGRVVIGGFFTTVNGVNRNYIARLNFDGSLDGFFNPGAGADNPVFAAGETFVGTARKVLLGGSFTTVDGVARKGIARLNENGSVDATFNPGLGTDGTVFAIAVQSNGKVLIGGDFTSVNGIGRNRIARLNADGSVDLSFNPGAGANGSVRAIALQTDGRILVGGFFTQVNGNSRNRVARLNADGSVDSSFAPGLGANDAVYSIAVQGDTRIVLGGEFTQASGVTRHRITRLNADGTVDPTINFGTGANSFIAAMAVQTDGKIVIGGGFTEFDGSPRPRIARLYGGSIGGAGSLEFLSANFHANEDATNALVTVRRRGGTSGAPGNISVEVRTSDGTAIAGTHYVAVSTNLAFPPGEVLGTVVIPIIDDVEINQDRTVNLALTNPAPVGLPSLGNQPTAVLTIVNDDSGVSFSAPAYTRNENAIDGLATIQVIRFGSLLGTVSVDFVTTTNGTATPGVDFIPVTNTLVFASGETNKFVTIPIINDALVEGDETVILELSNAVGAFLLSPATATLTIIDDDFAPGNLLFAAPAFFAREGTSNGVVTVIRTNGSTGVVSVNFATIGVTAIAGLDYIATNGTLVFADGEISKSFTVQVLDDAFVEDDETVSIILSNATGGATIIGPTSVPLTIFDNDVGLRFSSPAYFVSEGGGSVTLSVLRLNDSSGLVSVNYATTNVSATAGADYQATSGILLFTNGETVKTFTIPIFEDTLVEGDETFNVVLSNPSGAQLVAPSTATVAILDNDTGLSFSNAAFTVSENATNALITVLRTGALSGTVTVTFAAASGTATAGDDFVPVTGVLTFADGETIKTFTVPIMDDTEVEGDETVILTLSAPGGGAQLVAPSTATLTIIDNDSGLFFSSPDYTVNEGGVSVTITVLRANVLTNTVSVSFATTNGTAIAGQDYFATNGVLTFTNGETSKSFTVRVIDDTVIEGNETVLLYLFNPVGAASLLSPSAATLTIVDNDGSLIVPAGSALTNESGPVNGIIDPGETVTLLFAFRNTAGVTTTNLTATLLATNGVSAPSGAQSYGALSVGGPSVSRPFSFMANGTNGSRITATFRLQDNGFNLGTNTFTYTLGGVTNAFTNSGVILIPDSGPATPYPSVISVGGLDGVVSRVSVTLSNLNHTNPDDIDILLVSPAGQKLVLMSDAGGGNTLNNVTLTFDDAAPNSLPDSTLITNGVYKPTNYLLGDAFPAPAPPSPYGTTLSVFNGFNPNGNWSLYVVDDSPLDVGSISNGWRLTIATAAVVPAAADLSLTLSNAPGPMTVTSNFTYTILVTNHGPSTATNVTVSNALPASVTFISATTSQGSATTNASGAVLATLGTLTKDSSAMVAIVVRPNLAGMLTNVATVSAAQSDPNPDNNTRVALTLVSAPAADLAVSLADDPDPLFVGSSLTYSMVVSNFGPATATGVMLTNFLPPGVKFVSASSSRGTNSVSGSLVTFSLDSLGSGAQAGATVVVIPLVGGTITNIATVGSSVTDPLKGNNTASVKTIVEAAELSFARTNNNLVIAWPADASGFVLESTTNLAPPVAWLPVTDVTPQTVGGQKRVTIPIAGGSRFFRLTAPIP